jgi:CheY-like chemotaxis protein
MKTVLIVDDDPLILKIYQGPISAGGYRVEVAEDGLAAMKMLPQVRPDLVVLDVMMPKVDGPYVIRFIRSRPELKGAKIVVLSSAALADVAKTTLAENPDLALLKSEVTPKTLLAAINELLGNSNCGG